MSSAPHILLLAGLGNPGQKYAQTRHNAGFWFVDQLAEHGSAPWRDEGKFHGQVAKVRLADHELWLLKPQTYMNESGRAVQAMASFYKIAPEQILVAHDEIDLPAGTVRLKKGGGHGGNNGLRDIASRLGKEFLRLRIGVGRPAHASDVTNYVLNRPDADDHAAILRTLDEGEAVLPLLLSDGLEKAMHRLHSKRNEPSCAPRTRAKAKSAPNTAGKQAPADVDAVSVKPKTSKAPAARRRPDDDVAPEEPRSLKDQLFGLFRRH